MRCRRAQRWMVAAVDGELAPRRRRTLEGHVAGCPECRREVAATEAVLAGVTGLARSGCEVPSHLEQATLRRVRLLAAAEEEGSVARRWWAGFRIPALAFATAAVAIVAVELTRSEEHTSELQSRFDLVCRLLLEKKKKHEHIQHLSIK